MRFTPSVFAAALTVAAADSAAQTDTIEEILVTAATGSRIVRQGDSPSPLSIYDSRTLLDSGLKDIRDLVGVLSINAGAETGLVQTFPSLSGNFCCRFFCYLGESASSNAH